MRIIFVSMLVFFYCSIAYAFESEIVPMELQRILATKNDVLLLHELPSKNSAIIKKYQIKKNDNISFNESRTRTLKIGEIIVKANQAQLEGINYGNINYLSSKIYLETNNLEVFEFKKGDSFEELHDAPEGSCIIRWRKQLIWISQCFWHGDSPDYQVVRWPDYEWWIRITSNDKPQGWLLTDQHSSLAFQ